MLFHKHVLYLTVLIMQTVISNVVPAPAPESTPQVEPLILYGTTVKIEDFPFFAGTEICGGAIISDRWIITAAHCVDSRQKLGKKFIFVGGERRSNSILLRYNRYIIHPNYNQHHLINDLALLELETPLNFTAKVKPVKLPRTMSSNPRLVFIGRGNDETYRLSVTLKKMDVLRMSPNECKSAFNHSHQAHYFDKQLREQTIICGKRAEGGPGVCMGDSGSPLLDSGTIIGVASFIHDPTNRRNCHASSVAGYTNVAPFMSWITSVTGLK